MTSHAGYCFYAERQVHKLEPIQGQGPGAGQLVLALPLRPVEEENLAEEDENLADCCLLQQVCFLHCWAALEDVGVQPKVCRHQVATSSKSPPVAGRAKYTGGYVYWMGAGKPDSP